jgi:hypothetical protein
MWICILCEDKWIEPARLKANQLLSQTSTLNIPVSYTGSFPATHWLCVCHVSESMYQKMQSIRQYSTIHICSPKILLEELNLKKIK